MELLIQAVKKISSGVKLYLQTLLILTLLSSSTLHIALLNILLNKVMAPDKFKELDPNFFCMSWNFAHILIYIVENQLCHTVLNSNLA